MIPIIKERLQIGADVLGLLLLCIGVSSFLMMPIAGLFAQNLAVKSFACYGFVHGYRNYNIIHVT